MLRKKSCENHRPPFLRPITNRSPSTAVTEKATVGNSGIDCSLGVKTDCEI